MFFAFALQGALISAVAIVVWLWQGAGVATAVGFGGSVAWLNICLLLWRWRRGRYDYHCDGGRHLRQFHRSSMERFFVVAVMLAAGMFGLHLDPLATLLGFIVGQVGWMIAATSLKTD